MGYMELLPCTVGPIPGVPGVPVALVIVLGGLGHGGTSSLPNFLLFVFGNYMWYLGTCTGC